MSLGLSKTMSPMISPIASQASNLMVENLDSTDGGEPTGPFDYAEPCPPNCDERSIFNP